MGEGRTMSDPGLLRRRPSSLEVGRAQRALVQLAALLAALAGLVNAIGFLAFGHVFLASPDANATVLGANLPQSYAVALFAGAMVLSFVAGVTLMTLIAHRATQFRRTLFLLTTALVLVAEIGRASCRERVCQYVYISVVAVSLKKKKKK